MTDWPLLSMKGKGNKRGEVAFPIPYSYLVLYLQTVAVFRPTFVRSFLRSGAARLFTT